MLGEGAFGKVKVASLRADESKKFAIKSIPRSFFTKETQISKKEPKAFLKQIKNLSPRNVKKQNIGDKNVV